MARMPATPGASLRSGLMQPLFCMLKWRSPGGPSLRVGRNRFPRAAYTLMHWHGAEAAALLAHATTTGTSRKNPAPVGNPA